MNECSFGNVVKMVKALRDSYGYSEKRNNEAADMLEAQAKKISDLECQMQYADIVVETLENEGLELGAKLAEATENLNAAVRDLEDAICCDADECYYCAHHNDNKEGVSEYCGRCCVDEPMWEWRGLCDENGCAEDAAD